MYNMNPTLYYFPTCELPDLCCLVFVLLSWLQNAKTLIGELLPEDLQGAVIELEFYFRREWTVRVCACL